MSQQPTPQDLPLVIDEMRRAYAAFIEQRGLAEKSFIHMGLYLLKIHTLFEVHGPEAFGHTSFRAFVAAPVESGGCGVNYRTAYRLIGVVDRFVVQLEAPAERLLTAGHSKLDIVRPYASEETLEEVLTDATAMSESDLIEKYRGKPAPQAEVKTEIMTCPRCEFSWKKEKTG